MHKRLGLQAVKSKPINLLSNSAAMGHTEISDKKDITLLDAKYKKENDDDVLEMAASQDDAVVISSP